MGEFAIKRLFFRINGMKIINDKNQKNKYKPRYRIKNIFRFIIKKESEELL